MAGINLQFHHHGFLLLKYLFLFNFLLLFLPVTGQNTSPAGADSGRSAVTFKGNAAPENPKPLPDELKTKYAVLSSYEFVLSLAVLCFGILTILLEIYLIKSKKISSDNLVKFVVVTLIITGTLFLITAGYNNNQIAPAAGLFGTIAGYLLGKSSPKKEENEI
ncbi:MAG: hypothetical protein WCK63_18560 [Betaproteobacteria bacterium]